MKHAALSILVLFLLVTQASDQDDERADTTFILGSRW